MDEDEISAPVIPAETDTEHPAAPAVLAASSPQARPVPGSDRLTRAVALTVEEMNPDPDIPDTSDSHIVYVGPGAAVSYEGRGTGGNDLILEKGIPVPILDDAPPGTNAVPAAFAERLVAERLAEYTG